jgi:hypothetical protein
METSEREWAGLDSVETAERRVLVRKAVPRHALSQLRPCWTGDRLRAREHAGPERETTARRPSPGPGVHGQGLWQGHRQTATGGFLSFARDGDTVVVHSMDRLARNLDDLRALVQRLTLKGMRVEFVKEHLLFTGEDSPMANLVLSVAGGPSRNLNAPRSGNASAKASPWPSSAAPSRAAAQPSTLTSRSRPMPSAASKSSTCATRAPSDASEPAGISPRREAVVRPISTRVSLMPPAVMPWPY